MTEPLYIRDKDPIELIGSLDADGELQVLYGGDSLAEHDQVLYAEHQDLHDSSGVVRLKLNDFSSGGAWIVNAEHDPGSGAVPWPRGPGYVYCDFGPTTADQHVDVTATRDGSASETKTRRVRIKISPTHSQPDRPRD